MINKAIFAIFFFCLLFFPGIPRSLAEEEKEIGVKAYGVIHNIAEDRKVVKYGGIYEPEGLDMYVKRHLDDMASKIISLEQKVGDLEKKLEEAIRLLKELKSLSKAPEAA